ncbi:hypothetical protein [Ideonella sp. BN130291]|uniref:hypothetical protein n=1 Tax=Ideonella sp. BN130291 TaxID=3112940 RepID=UPI002E26EC2F|nr:hypothetical protein [Ideonella sp. BN130291]
MVTSLEKELKRQVTVDGAQYILTLHPDGFRLTGKGKRKPQVELHWRDLLSGDAAMAVALNASLAHESPPRPTASGAGRPSSRKPIKAAR